MADWAVSRLLATAGLMAAALWLLASSTGCLTDTAVYSEIEPAAQFPNIENTPFATRTEGPRGAVTYEARSVEASAMRGALESALASRAAATRGGDEPEGAFTRFLVAHGQKSPEVRFRPNRRAVPVRDGRVLYPSLASAGIRQGGDLTFRFQGFSQSDAALLASIATKAYPLCRTYYGAPAFPHEVTVKLDASISNFAEGIYDAGTDTILLAPLSDNPRNTTFALVRHILHAFRDDAMLHYDAWEEGQVIAVANLVMADLEADWDPTLDRSEYSLNLYELLNAPELGNDAIWNTGFRGLVAIRLALSSGAWLKLLVEDPLAMAQFNEAYYPLFAGDTSIAGDVPRLASLMAGVVPEVEGRTFYDWFRSQYALDTSVPVGRRLYAGMIPTYDAAAIFVTHTVVGADGRERGEGGVVALEFWDYTHQYSLFVQEGYTIPIPATGGSAGIGEFSGSLYNIGGQQRITIDLVLEPIVKHLLFAYNSRREDLDYQADPNGVNLYGAIAGRDSGTVRVSIRGGPEEEATLTQGAFRGHFGEGFIKPGKLRFTFTDGTGVEATRVINTGYFDYAIVDHIERRDRLTHTFTPTTTGLQLISFPAWPVGTDEAAILGRDRDRVLLASWQADAAGEDKYRIYPDLPPVAPGRGYWLRTTESIPVDLAVGLPDSALPYRIPLSPGWNLVGIPQNARLPVSSLRFDRGTEPVGFSQAVQNGWVRAVVFQWDGETGSYQEATSLEPWAGYWIRSIIAGGCNIRFFGLQAEARQAQETPALPDRLRSAGALVVEIEVAAGGSAVPVVLARHPLATAGIDPEWDVEAPPPPLGQTLRAGVIRECGLLAYDCDSAASRDVLVQAGGGLAPELRVLGGCLRLSSDGAAPVVLNEGDKMRLPNRAVSVVRVEVL